MRHDTQDIYPVMNFPSPVLDVLRQYGRISVNGVNGEILELSEGLGDSPSSPAVLERLLSHPKSALICDAFGIPVVDDVPDDDYSYTLPVDEVKEARETVRSYKTDELRLLAAVGEVELRKGLPESLVDILEAQYNGPLNGLQVARAAIAMYHTGSLWQYRGTLNHLDPPRRWAGSPGAVAFVKSLGLDDEWAMEPGTRHDPYIDVEGPFQLPSLHPYQRFIVNKVKGLIRSNGLLTERRGMISFAYGIGKNPGGGAGDCRGYQGGRVRRRHPLGS